MDARATQPASPSLASTAPTSGAPPAAEPLTDRPQTLWIALDGDTPDATKRFVNGHRVTRRSRGTPSLFGGTQGMLDTYAMSLTVPLGMFKLLSMLSVVDHDFARRRKPQWATLPTGRDSGIYAPMQVSHDKLWSSEQQGISADAAKVDPGSVTRPSLELRAGALTRQFVLCATGYSALCMSCSMCHALCVLNVNRKDRKRFGFFVNTGETLVGKTREWVTNLTSEQIDHWVNNGGVKQCCQENKKGDCTDKEVFIDMAKPVLPRHDAAQP